jgi:hypothetical protein
MMPALRSLDLSGSSFHHGGESQILQALRSDKKLKRLRLAHCSLEGDEVVSALEDHPSLVGLE